MKYGKFLGISLAIFALAALVGCANALPEYAGKMDVVELTTKKTLGGAKIDLQDEKSGGLAGMATKATGAAAAIKIKKKFQKNVKPEAIRPIVWKEVNKALSNGNPFKAVKKGDKKVDGKMQVYVYEYGMQQEGSTPVFYTTYKTKIWYNHPDGEQEMVYKWHWTCDGKGLFEPEGKSGVAGTAAFLSYVNNMTDKMFTQTVHNGFARCSQKLAQRLRKKSQK